MASPDEEGVVDVGDDFLRDNDSLYVLPLKFVPLQTMALRRGRLIKTFSLEPAVEIFKYTDQGRGYLLVDDLASGKADAVFDWEEDPDGHADSRLLAMLGRLHSYDVYTLRINFRDLGIDYEGNDYLQLSDSMKSELAIYMRQFTLPLMQTVFGDSQSMAYASDNVADLFRAIESPEAMRKLTRFAERLSIRPHEIADFLEEFSDVYSAISYYRHYADQVGEMNEVLIREIDALRHNFRWKDDPVVNDWCRQTCTVLRTLLEGVHRRLRDFDTATAEFWQDLNADSFRDIRHLLRDSQMTIAGVLCGLGVKLSAWRHHFPTEEHGSANRRFDVLQTEMRPGLAKLLKIAGLDETEPALVRAEGANA